MWKPAVFLFLLTCVWMCALVAQETPDTSPPPEPNGKQQSQNSAGSDSNATDAKTATAAQGETTKTTEEEMFDWTKAWPLVFVITVFILGIVVRCRRLWVEKRVEQEKLKAGEEYKKSIKGKKQAGSFHNRFEYNAEYILIPGGSFKYSVTKKVVWVNHIYFAKYPVTNRLYRRFIRYLEEKERELLEILPKGEFDKEMTKYASRITDFRNYLGNRPNSWPEKLRSNETNYLLNGEDQPVVGVSWFAAKAYCLWLSLLEMADMDLPPYLYRLPTEIEWEWAASEGKREYPWVPDKGPPSDKLANYDDHYHYDYYDDHYKGEATTPVGRYLHGATPEGLMDMAGNVSEWMYNWYEHYEGKFRSLRGGSWNNNENDLRCSYRSMSYPVYRCDKVGFRVVRSLL